MKNKLIKLIVGYIITLTLFFSLVCSCFGMNGGVSPLNGDITEESAEQLDQAGSRLPKLNKTALVLVAGKSAKLSVKFVKANRVSWICDDTTVATVSKGKVKAVGRGTTQVRALIDGEEVPELVCNVTVQAKMKKLSLSYAGDMVYAKTSQEAETLSCNQVQLRIITNPAITLDPTEVRFTTSKASIATVSSNGVVTAGARAGKVTITASYGGKKGKLKLTILPASYYTGEGLDPDVAVFCDSSLSTEAEREYTSVRSDNVLYVSPEGDDNGDGTGENPFRSIQKALNEAEAGCIIYLRDGIYPGQFKFKNSGSEGKYIVLMSYPGEQATLTGSSGKNGAVIDLNGCDYIRIQDLEIRDHKAKKVFGILLGDTEHHVVIQNNIIHHLATTTPKQSSGECNGILCIGFGTTEETGIHDIWIEGNEIYGNTNGWSENLSIAANCRNVSVLDNTIHDNTNIGIDFYGNARYCSNRKLDQPRNCVARWNTVYNVRCSYAQCAGIYVDGARDILIDNNDVHDNMYGIEVGSEEAPGYFPVKNIYVRRNNLENNTAGGIRIGGFDTKKTGTVKDCEITGNRLQNNGAGENGYNGELNFEKCKNILVKENHITKSNNTYPMVGEELPAKYVTGITFSGNVYKSPDPDGIWFDFHRKSVTGVDAFNVLTGGNDTSEALE